MPSNSNTLVYALVGAAICCVGVAIAVGVACYVKTKRDDAALIDAAAHGSMRSARVDVLPVYSTEAPPFKDAATLGFEVKDQYGKPVPRYLSTNIITDNAPVYVGQPIPSNVNSENTAIVGVVRCC
jgi:hypothetical protein